MAFRTASHANLKNATGSSFCENPAVLQQDAWSVLHNCWAPHEFVNHGGSNNIVAPMASLPPLVLPQHTLLRPSEATIAEMKFETMHHLFNRKRVKPVSEVLEAKPESGKVYRGDVLSRPFTRTTCIGSNMGTSSGQTSVAHRVVGMLDVFQITASRRAVGAIQSASQSELSFTLCTRVADSTRTVIVERAQSHFEILFSALSQVFPEYLLPVAEKSGDICDLHVDALLELITKYSRTLSSFLPLLFFLFETNLKQFAMYFSRLEDQYESLNKNDAALFVPQKGKASAVAGVIRGFIRSNNTTQEPVLSDAEVIAESHELLPPRFIVQYSIAKEVETSCVAASKACNLLYMALAEEGETLQDVTELIGSLDESFFALPPAIDPTKDPYPELSSDWVEVRTSGGPTNTDVNTTPSGSTWSGTFSSNAFSSTLQRESLRSRVMIVSQFLNQALAHQLNGAMPIVKTMSVSMQMAGLCGTELGKYVSRPLESLRTLADREKKLLAEQKRVGADQLLISSMVEAISRQRQKIANFTNEFETEKNRCRMKRVDALRQVSSHGAAMAMHLAEGYVAAVEHPKEDQQALLSAEASADFSPSGSASSGAARVDLVDAQDRPRNTFPLTDFPSLIAQLQVDPWPTSLTPCFPLRADDRPPIVAPPAVATVDKEKVQTPTVISPDTPSSSAASFASPVGAIGGTGSLPFSTGD